jgi:hypothetical protein
VCFCATNYSYLPRKNSVTLTYIAAERTRTYSQQISRDRYPAVYWRVGRIYRRHSFLYCCVLNRVYRAVTWQRIDQIRYNIFLNDVPFAYRMNPNLHTCASVICVWLQNSKPTVARNKSQEILTDPEVWFSKCGIKANAPQYKVNIYSDIWPIFTDFVRIL